MVKVGVNGFGRIGRNVIRAAMAGNYGIEFVAVNDLTDAANLAYLLKYDSVHGTIPNEIKATTNGIAIDGREIRVYSNPDPADIPWSDLGVEIVVESSGPFSEVDRDPRFIPSGSSKYWATACLTGLLCPVIHITRKKAIMAVTKSA